MHYPNTEEEKDRPQTRKSEGINKLIFTEKNIFSGEYYKDIFPGNSDKAYLFVIANNSIHKRSLTSFINSINLCSFLN